MYAARLSQRPAARTSEEECSRGSHELISLLASLRDLVRLTLPLVGGLFISTMSDRWTIAFVGHWDYEIRAHYDAAGIGKMYSSITGLSLGTAALTGLSTFAAQAHGAGTSDQVSALYVWRAMFLLTIIFSFPLLAALCSEHVFLATGMPPDVARCSAIFVKVQLLGLPFYWVSSAARVALNSVKRTSPGLWTQTISAVVQIILSIIFIHPDMCNLGYVGAALARSAGGVVAMVTMVICVKAEKLEHLVWHTPPNVERVVKSDSLRSYLAVSIPSALTMWSEWWAFEILAALVGWTPAAEREVNLAAHGTMFNLICVVYMVWTGASNAMCTLVGNHIGAERQIALPSLLKAAFLLALVTSAVVSVGYEIWKLPLAKAFTEDTVVQQALADNSLGLVLSVPLYAQLMTFYGALRGANRQRPAIVATVVGYWIIGLPAGGVLGCVWCWPTPLTGVWMGNVIALFIAATWVCMTVFVRIDWLHIRRLSDIARAQAVPLLPQAHELPPTCPAAAQNTVEAPNAGQSGGSPTEPA